MEIKNEQLELNKSEIVENSDLQTKVGVVQSFTPTIKYESQPVNHKLLLKKLHLEAHIGIQPDDANNLIQAGSNFGIKPN